MPRAPLSWSCSDCIALLRPRCRQGVRPLINRRGAGCPSGVLLTRSDGATCPHRLSFRRGESCRTIHRSGDSPVVARNQFAGLAPAATALIALLLRCTGQSRGLNPTESISPFLVGRSQSYLIGLLRRYASDPCRRAVVASRLCI